MARLSMDMRIERIKILAETDRLEKERCDKCANGNYTATPCCEANAKVIELGKQLIVMVSPRKTHDETVDPQYTYWQEKAIENGIPKEVYRHRVMSNATDYERAATLPLGQADKNSRYTDEVWARAKAIGLKKGTVRNRLSRGWTLEQAISRPPGYDKRKKQYK